MIYKFKVPVRDQHLRADDVRMSIEKLQGRRVTYSNLEEFVFPRYESRHLAVNPYQWAGVEIQPEWLVSGGCHGARERLAEFEVPSNSWKQAEA